MTPDKWETLSWRERIEYATASLRITKKELAEKLGVTDRTIRVWWAGKSEPSSKYADAIRELCVHVPFSDLKESAFMAFQTLSVDAAMNVLALSARTNSASTKYMATCCIAMKVASVLEAAEPNKLMIKLSYLLGESEPAKLQIQGTKYPAEERAAEIKIGQVTGSKVMSVLSTTLFLKGHPSAKFAFTVTDRAVVVTARRIISFLLT